MSSNIVMNKSQLRKLAREYSLGNLEEDEYRLRRRHLVDDIVSGKVAIVREVPPPPRQAYSEDPTTKVSITGPGSVRRLTSALIFIALVVVAGVIWMVIPPAWQGDPDGPGVQQPNEAPPVSRARSLIEEFVADKDFSAFSIASFKESWSHLTYMEKRQAYAAHWFNDLITLISDEIKAQNALVASGPASEAMETGRRLADFASFLGISEYVTEFKSAPAEPAAAVAASDSGGSDASAPVIGAAPQQTGSAQMQNASLDTAATAPDRGWLHAQADEAYTLQLFAVNQLNEIQSLISSNPGVDLHVLISAHNEPRYRVVHGAFESENAARSAYAKLPQSIRQAQPVPLVKSVSALREEIGEEKSPADGQVASVNASKFTLQVFATDSVDSAKRLQADFPALGLDLLETTNPYTRYRVLYGTFDSEDMAKKAAGGLPVELLQNVGDPLIKTVSELEAVKR